MKLIFLKFKIEVGIKQEVGNCKESGHKTLYIYIYHILRNNTYRLKINEINFFLNLK